MHISSKVVMAVDRKRQHNEVRDELNQTRESVQHPTRV